ncbi:MAG TPA: Stk1 family PASTA domain-containing Ser/Thr kinase [Pseudonocardiaceae bacterium]
MERQGPGQNGIPVGTLLDGRYRVGSTLACGGMSTVYHGIDTRLERPVAVKVMDPRFAADPIFLQRFEREARAAARLHHPGIVGVYDQGVDTAAAGDHVFLVMELVEGGTLRDLLREYGRLPVPLVLSVIELVLSALAAAHREGLVHRDVKPENVLIGPGGVVKVADFGLVRAAAEASNNTGDLILGTVAYLSPEQVATGTADPRSDVYAAGVLMFEMLTGAPPYTGETALSVAYRHVNDDMPAPGTVAPAVPAPLDALVVRATRRDPGIRPSNASDFLIALRQVRAELQIGQVRVPLPSATTAIGTAPANQPGSAASAVSPAAARTALAAPLVDHGPRGTRAIARTELPSGAPMGPPGPAGAAHDRNHPPDDPYQRQRSRERRAFITWILVVLMLASVVGVSAWWLGSGRWTVVPNLTGLQRTAVQAVLDDASLTPKLTTGHDNAIPNGTVIRSDPAPGRRAIRGSDVTVVVSLGRPVVPGLAAGTPAAEAEQALTAADLSPRNDPAAAQFHDTVPEGTLIGLQPAAGTVLTVGAPVTLVISRGPAPTTVPQVRGLSEADAIAALSRAGLTARVQRQFDDQIPGGHAIGTDPQAGEGTSRGTEVTLQVSTALVVPEVVGLPREQALAALSRAGFEPQEEGDGAGQPGAVVLSVQPGEGSLVATSDNRVTVQLSTEIAIPEVVGLPADRAQQILTAAGLNSQVRQFFGGSSARVVAQSPGAGRTVRPGTTIQLITF